MIFFYKVQYTVDILRRIDDRLVDEYVINKLYLCDVRERNYFYNKKCQRVFGEIDLLDRIFRPETKDVYLLGKKLK